MFSSPEDAIKEAFPNAQIERKAVYLSSDERKSIEEKYQVNLGGTFHTFYIAKSQGAIVGYGIFDTHKVRTKDETLFIVVDTKGFIKKIKLISFFEPDDYRAPERWLKRFEGRSLSDPLIPGKDITIMTGATLTTNKVAAAARRVLVLAMHHFGAKQ